MPEVLEAPMGIESDRDFRNSNLEEWGQSVAEIDQHPEWAEALIKRGQELYADIRNKAYEATQQGQDANYKSLEIPKLPLRDRRRQEKIVNMAVEVVNQKVRSIDEQRKYLHLQLAKLYMVVGKSPDSEHITIDQFQEAAGKDVLGASMIIAKNFLKKSGDTPISSIQDELKDFDPDLYADLNEERLNTIALNYARHKVEKDLGFVN